MADYVDSLVRRGVISDDAAARMMTHQAEQPNPARPYLDFASNFASGGLQQAMGLPNNAVGEALQNPDNQAAMGMAGSRLSRPAIEARLAYLKRLQGNPGSTQSRTWGYAGQQGWGYWHEGGEGYAAAKKHFVDEGGSVTDFAKAQGISTPVASKIRKQFDLEPLARGSRPKDIDFDQVQQLRDQGLSWADINERAGGGLSFPQFYARVKRAGLTEPVPDWFIDEMKQ